MADPATRQVIAGVPQSWPPQYSVDEDGNPTGFAIDVMEEIAARAGLRVDYRVMGSFAEVSEAMSAGQIDLIPNSGITPERAARYAFTAPVETFVVSIFVRNDTLDIRGADDLRGHKVGVVEFNIGQRLMQDRDDLELVVYRDVETALFSLVAGHVDAMVFPQPVVLNLARQVGIEDRIEVVGAPLRELKRGIRVQRGEAKLLAVLNQAVSDFVGSPAYQAIYVKWYGRAEPFWTAWRVLAASSTTVLLVLIATVWWRYHSVVKLNRELRASIAERKDAEQALRKSKQRIRDFAETASDWFWEMDENLRFTYFSNRFTHFRLDTNERIGRTRIETTTDDTNQPKWRDHLADLAARKPFKNFEHTTRFQDGGLVHISISGTPIFNEGGVFRGYRGTGTDITERKQAEEALRESEERFRAVVDHSPTKIHIKDLEGRYLLINKVAERLFGVSNDEARGKMSLDIFSKRQAEAFRRHDRAVLDADRAIEVEEVWLRDDGVQTFLTVKFPIRGASGKTVAIGAIGTDITERKSAEKIALKAREEAEFANRAKSEFLANMSHELRTPLNAIIGFSEILQNEMLGPIGNPKYRGYATDISESGQHLLELINDILDLSKIESGTVELGEENLDVLEVVRSSVLLLKERAQSGAVSIEQQLPATLPELRGDRRRLKQILVNLLSNAVKFTPPGGGVVIKAWHGPDSGHVLQVTDTGIGMAHHELGRALAPFQQVDSRLNRKYEGSGLGLALTKSLVELHGGRLDLQSELGVGTTVTVRFPAERLVSGTSTAA